MRRVFAAGCAVFLSVLAACDQAKLEAKSATVVEVMGPTVCHRKQDLAAQSPTTAAKLRSGEMACVDPVSGCVEWFDASIVLLREGPGDERRMFVSAVQGLSPPPPPNAGETWKPQVWKGVTLDGTMATLGPRIGPAIEETIAFAKPLSKACVVVDMDLSLPTSDLVGVHTALKREGVPLVYVLEKSAE